MHKHIMTFHPQTAECEISLRYYPLDKPLHVWFKALVNQMPSKLTHAANVRLRFKPVIGVF